jgi:3-methyladenine DNA glycosylase/8-oxoguanine DNA glycosylase
VVWRSVRQDDARTIVIEGTGSAEVAADWAARTLGTRGRMPSLDDPVLRRLASEHRGLRSWSAGSLYEGAVSSIVGQSISVAAAATTERRLCELFNPPLDLGDRLFWPPPLPAQLAAATPQLVRQSGVTMRRAEALIEVAAKFTNGEICESTTVGFDASAEAEKLMTTSGVGRWTVRSALLWGLGDPDAHPSGDVALLRAARKHYPELSNLKELDTLAETWAPHRGWAARLLWLDLLGFKE